MDINKFMAEEVMGWHKGYGLSTGVLLWLNEYDAGIMPVKDWHPTEDLDQVMMCIENANLIIGLWYDACRGKSKWSLTSGGRLVGEFVTREELPLAICQAIMKVVGDE